MMFYREAPMSKHEVAQFETTLRRFRIGPYQTHGVMIADEEMKQNKMTVSEVLFEHEVMEIWNRTAHEGAP